MNRLFKFITVGASGTLIGLGLLFLLTDLAGWHYLLSYTIAFVCSTGNNYLWNSLWTFKGKQSNITGYSKYLAISIITLCINLSMMYLLTEIAGLWYIASAVTVTVIVFLINFVASKRYVWSKNIVR